VIIIALVLLLTTVLLALWGVSLFMSVRRLREERYWLLQTQESVQAALWEQAEWGRPRP